jgi:hypothetical protein
MATAGHKFSREAAFVLASEALQDAAMASEDDCDTASAPGFGPVKEAIQSYCRDPNEYSRARLERATSEFRAARRATALARWRSPGGQGHTH